MGSISPLSINPKLLFQELREAKCEWDHPLEGTLKRKWQKLVDNLKEVHPSAIPRCYLTGIQDRSPSVIDLPAPLSFALSLYVESV